MKIRVLEVLATLKRAGAEHVAVSLACTLDRDRFQTALISLFDPFPGGLEPVLGECGVPVWHLNKRRGFDPRMYHRLARVLRQFQPDIVHTHSYVLRYTLPAGIWSRVPFMVHTIHNLADREVERLGRMVHRIAFRRGVRPVAVGEEVARSVRATYGIDLPATIPNGIDTARYFRPDAREQWRRVNGFAPDDLLVVSLARLDPQKDPIGLVESFGAAARGNTRCHLLLAGDGPLKETARQRAVAHSIADRVHFLGVRADIPELLSASDIFVLASIWEGRPVAVMEAMAAGLPVIATAVGGVRELIQNGVTGLLVPSGEPGLLADAIASLIGDSERRRVLGEEARQVAARFSLDTMVYSYAELFERLVRGGP